MFKLPIRSLRCTYHVFIVKRLVWELELVVLTFAVAQGPVLQIVEQLTLQT